MLSQLIYYSERVRGTTCAVVDEIVAQAQAKNRARGITGVLIFHDPYFIQILEGHRLELSALAARMATDRRHTHMCVVQMQAIDDRHYGAWDMEQIAPCSVTQHDYVTRAGERVGFEPGKMTGDEIQAMLDICLQDKLDRQAGRVPHQDRGIAKLHQSVKRLLLPEGPGFPIVTRARRLRKTTKDWPGDDTQVAG